MQSCSHSRVILLPIERLHRGQIQFFRIPPMLETHFSFALYKRCLSLTLEGKEQRHLFSIQMLRMLLGETVLSHMALLPFNPQSKGWVLDIRENVMGTSIYSHFLLSATKRISDISVLRPWASQ